MINPSNIQSLLIPLLYYTKLHPNAIKPPTPRYYTTFRVRGIPHRSIGTFHSCKTILSLPSLLQDGLLRCFLLGQLCFQWTVVLIPIITGGLAIHNTSFYQSFPHLILPIQDR